MSVEAAGEQQGVKTQSEDHEQNEDLCEYERLRQANIADQKRHFKELFQGVKKTSRLRQNEEPNEQNPKKFEVLAEFKRSAAIQSFK